GSPRSSSVAARPVTGWSGWSTSTTSGVWSSSEVPALAPEVLVHRAARLTWLLFDVDGVLTDGRLVYGARGEEQKVFEVRDGLGLKLAQRAGLRVGLLSGRESRALARRAAELR